MSDKCYGNLSNRLEEGRIYTEDKLIHVGDDITMYHYSDRTCYYITEVINQKHIKVLPYHICADHSKEGGQGHQNWLYFKTVKECNEYLYSITQDERYNQATNENEPQVWVFRNNNWKQAITITPENAYRYLLNKTQAKQIASGKSTIQYLSLPGKISFGVRDHYYDWEF